MKYNIREILQLFLVFLKLGLTSFGGPIAHLAYFRDEFVKRREWLSEKSYAALVGLCQFLPGPASSQVGISIGLSKGGIAGALAAWLGFTLPSAILMLLLALKLPMAGDQFSTFWIHGLKLFTVAVVAQAILGMWRSLCTDRLSILIAILTGGITLLDHSFLTQFIVLIGAGLVGGRYSRRIGALPDTHLPCNISPRFARLALGLFLILLTILPFAAQSTGSFSLLLFVTFFQVGGLIFGGGHVVLPLLQSQVVSSGWLSNETFLTGYGLAQLVPGPMFSFAAYLGAATQTPAGSLWGGIIALVAIFLPSFLLIFATLPFWEGLRRYQPVQMAMHGTNAAVVGLLIAAFYDPIWVGSIHSPSDIIISAVLFSALHFWSLPVILTASLSILAAYLLQ